MSTKHTPGPWEYVPSTEFHGPYITSAHGTTIADCYTMSNPSEMSVRNGGDSRPIHHLAEMADPNAQLIAAAPEAVAALKLALEYWEHRLRRYKNRVPAWVTAARAAVTKAEGVQ